MNSELINRAKAWATEAYDESKTAELLIELLDTVEELSATSTHNKRDKMPARSFIYGDGVFLKKLREHLLNSGKEVNTRDIARWNNKPPKWADELIQRLRKRNAIVCERGPKSEKSGTMLRISLSPEKLALSDEQFEQWLKGELK